MAMASAPAYCPAGRSEIVEELSQHLDQRYDELRRNGATDADARRLAIAELREPETLAAYMRPLRQANVPEPARRLVHVVAPDRSQSAETPGVTLWRASSSNLSNMPRDRKSTRLNSSHITISYAVFCL